MTIKNSVLGPGGDADGIQNDADGVQILEQRVHRDPADRPVHTDSLQLYGARNTVIRGNYFHNFDVAIMAPDGGSNEQITDNVFIGTASYRPAIQLGGHRNTVFAHNVSQEHRRLHGRQDRQPAGGNNVVRDKS